MRTRVSPSAAIKPSTTDKTVGAAIASYAALERIKKLLPKLLPKDAEALRELLDPPKSTS